MARRAGVVTFAGVLFIIAGLFTIYDGIIAIERPDQFYVGETVFTVTDFDSWGAGLIAYGGVQALVGIGVLGRWRLAQVVAIVIAAVSFIGTLAYFRHYPAWAVTVLVLDLIVIYSLTVHGDEFARRRSR
jgi:hypothetical protein